jgi:hypothetical protein
MKYCIGMPTSADKASSLTAADDCPCFRSGETVSHQQYRRMFYQKERVKARSLLKGPSSQIGIASKHYQVAHQLLYGYLLQSFVIKFSS